MYYSLKLIFTGHIEATLNMNNRASYPSRTTTQTAVRSSVARREWLQQEVWRSTIHIAVTPMRPIVRKL